MHSHTSTNPETRRVFPKIWAVLLCVALGISVLIAVGMPFKNEDLLLALCAGRDSWNGSLASPDRWSFITEGHVWVDQSWLAHLIFYLSYMLMGALGPILVKGCLLAGSLLIIYYQCRAFRVTKELSILAMTLGVLGVAPFLNIRAHDFAMLYFLALSSVLTAPGSWGRWRHLAAILIMALWSNSHGSFMLGFALIGLRFLLDLARSLPVVGRRRLPAGEGYQERQKGPQEGTESVEGAAFSRRPTAQRERSDPYAWLAALGATVGIMAFANPFGLENLAMPFSQFFGVERTLAWPDWLPLISQPFLWERGLYMPLSVVPYLILAALTVIVLVVMLFKVGFRETASLFTHRPSKADLGAQIMISTLIFIVTLKFQRLIVFAAPSIVPLLALLLEVYRESLARTRHNLRESLTHRYRTALCSLLMVLWVSFVALIFYRYVGIPRLPSNPLNPLDRPMVAQLMNYNLVCESVGDFMKKNHLSGRVVANLDLSNYLLFHVPGIQVFADLRAHSAYGPTTLETLYLLLYFGHEKPEESLALLDRFQVSYLVLDTLGDRCAGLVTELIRTKQWACIYKDPWVYVLARADSEKFGRMIASGDLGELWYNSPETRIVTQALLCLSVKGSWPDELLREVKALLRQHPDPDIYDLVAASDKRSGNCLTDYTASFFKDELSRLAASDFRVPGGSRSILASMLTIIDALRADDAHCRSHARSAEYGRVREQLVRIIIELKRRYNPW